MRGEEGSKEGERKINWNHTFFSIKKASQQLNFATLDRLRRASEFGGAWWLIIALNKGIHVDSVKFSLFLGEHCC